MPFAAQLSAELALGAVGQDHPAAANLMRTSIADLEDHRADQPALEGDIDGPMTLDGNCAGVECNLANLCVEHGARCGAAMAGQ